MNSLSRISLNNINFKSKMPMPTPKPTPNNNDSQTIFIKPSIHNYEKPTGGHVPGEKHIDKIP